MEKSAICTTFMGLRESFVKLMQDYSFSKFYFILFS